MTPRTLAFRTFVVLLIGASAAHGQEFTPAYDRIRAGLQRDQADLRVAGERPVLSAGLPKPASTVRVAASNAQRRSPQRRGSIWGPLLIGIGVGAAAGSVWGAAQCDAPDPECTAITVPVGMLGGAGIGAAAGAVIHAIRR